MWGMTIDPAQGKPFAISWWWVEPNGTIVFDSEWPETDWTKTTDTDMKLVDYCMLFKRVEGGRRMEWRILDRHYGNNRNILTGKTMKQDFYDLGFDFQNSYNCEEEVDTGIRKVIEYLSYDKSKPIDSVNTPRVFFKKRCHNIQRSMTKWCRKKDSYEPDKMSVYKDFADTVRYTCMMQPEPYVPIVKPVREKVYAVGR
jgi:hypothetical protein